VPRKTRPTTAAEKRGPAAAKPTAADPKQAAAAAKPARRRAEPEIAQTAPPAEDPRRLLREAAWAKMFGRSGLNNPFGR
jgi:hypothetical protein